MKFWSRARGWDFLKRPFAFGCFSGCVTGVYLVEFGGYEKEYTSNRLQARRI